jgi:hypothetical protein
MDIVDFGTPFGLAFASGLNAYLPLLAYALSVRWLHLYTVNPRFAFITQTWCIALLAFLALLDFVADKIPLIDHAWNAIHTFVRPIAGAFVAIVASSHTFPVAYLTPASVSAGQAATITALGAIPVVGIGLLVVLIVGAALAFLSHSAKSTTRFVSTLTTAGLLNWVMSLGEDILALIVILLSLFASAVMLVLLLLLVLILLPRIIRPRNAWIGKRWRF